MERQLHDKIANSFSELLFSVNNEDREIDNDNNDFKNSFIREIIETDYKDLYSYGEIT